MFKENYLWFYFVLVSIYVLISYPFKNIAYTLANFRKIIRNFECLDRKGTSKQSLLIYSSIKWSHYSHLCTISMYQYEKQINEINKNKMQIYNYEI